MATLLIVEDDKQTNEAICEYLKSAGHKIVPAFDGVEALKIFEQGNIDLVILDIMLPKITGLAVLHEIRKRSILPVLMLTAIEDEYTQVKSFDEQADDYITKPFNPLELVARVRSQLRRYTVLGSQAAQTDTVYENGGLSVDDERKEVTVDGQPVHLTPSEYKILLLLLKNAGKVFSIEQIYEQVWNEPAYSAENTVAVHIRRIREKIEINPKEPKYLKVVWGVGYRIEKI